MMEKPAEVNAALVGFAARAGAVPMRAFRPGRPADVVLARGDRERGLRDDLRSGGTEARLGPLPLSLRRRRPPRSRRGPRPAGDCGPTVLDPDGYIRRAEAVFATTAFHEKEIARRVERYGHIAHVFSTYEARHDPADAKPFLRGINSFQLVFDGTRWWVLTIFWEAESETVKIPKEYLP